MTKQILKTWMLFAKSDLDAAKRLFNSPRPNRWTYLLTLWHCHQAIEKMLKMIMLEKGKELIKTHDLPRLLKLSEIDNTSEKYVNLIYNLNNFYLRPRYPDMVYSSFPNLDRKSTKKYLESTNELFLWLKKQA